MQRDNNHWCRSIALWWRGKTHDSTVLHNYRRVKASGSGELTGRWQSDADPPQEPLKYWKWWKKELLVCIYYILGLKNNEAHREANHFTPCGVFRRRRTIPAQHQHFIRLLMIRIQREHKLSRWGDLREKSEHIKHLDSHQMDQILMTDSYNDSKFTHLDPEPLSHHFYSPVWVELITDEAQVARAVCHPGDH